MAPQMFVKYDYANAIETFRNRLEKAKNSKGRGKKRTPEEELERREQVDAVLYSADMRFAAAEIILEEFPDISKQRALEIVDKISARERKSYDFRQSQDLNDVQAGFAALFLI